VPEGVEGVDRALGGAKTSEGVVKAEQAQPGGAGIVAGVGNIAPFIDLKGVSLFVLPKNSIVTMSLCRSRLEKGSTSCRGMHGENIANL
jgi:hypothetical protein